jgi:beta-N-acetylhexosaminidase
MDVSGKMAAIFGLEGLEISDWERGFFKDADPFGYILFSRNIISPEQLRALTDDLRQLSGREDVPILIDQEGGRVQRLAPPQWCKRPPQGVFGEMYATAPDTALHAARLNATLIALDLRRVGIGVDCLPVLDVPVSGAHDIIGDRAFHAQPDVIALFGQAVCDGLMDAGVAPVIKHIPGHGRGMADSHLELPVVSAQHADLAATDFVPFKALKHAPYGMTAHITYTNLDAAHPATLSRVVIENIIRKEIGFDGLLMSDDLSMKALSGSFADRTTQAQAAGCDLVLHCNGNANEMQQIADAAQAVSPAACQRAARIEASIAILPEDAAQMQHDLDMLLAPYWQAD